MVSYYTNNEEKVYTLGVTLSFDEHHACLNENTGIKVIQLSNKDRWNEKNPSILYKVAQLTIPDTLGKNYCKKILVLAKNENFVFR